jgi:hypothetical protein
MESVMMHVLRAHRVLSRSTLVRRDPLDTILDPYRPDSLYVKQRDKSDNLAGSSSGASSYECRLREIDPAPDGRTC